MQNVSGNEPKVIPFPNKKARSKRSQDAFFNNPEIRNFFMFVKANGFRKEALALIEKKLAVEGKVLPHEMN